MSLLTAIQWDYVLNMENGADPFIQCILRQKNVLSIYFGISLAYFRLNTGMSVVSLYFRLFMTVFLFNADHPSTEHLNGATKALLTGNGVKKDIVDNQQTHHFIGIQWGIRQRDSINGTKRPVQSRLVTKPVPNQIDVYGSDQMIRVHSVIGVVLSSLWVVYGVEPRVYSG